MKSAPPTAPLVESVRGWIRRTWFESCETLYVFPSEVAARYWARDTARYGGLGTVLLSRFVSWDSFKELVFRGGEDRVPANALVRSMFAQLFLAANAGEETAGTFADTGVEPAPGSVSAGRTGHDVLGVYPGHSAGTEGGKSGRGRETDAAADAGSGGSPSDESARDPATAAKPAAGNGVPIFPGRTLASFLPERFKRDYAGFVQPLARMLPRLELLFGRSEDGAAAGVHGIGGRRGIELIRHTGEPAYWDDLESIHRSYCRFLDACGYYEPTWVDRTPCDTGWSAVVFFPELLEDWYEYAPFIRTLPGVRIAGLPGVDAAEPAGMATVGSAGAGAHAAASIGAEGAVTAGAASDCAPKPVLDVFANQAEELGAVMDRIEDYLDAGGRPGEVVVTLAGYGQGLPFLEREARRRGIPLEGRAGKPLSGFAGPGLFARLRELETDGYSHEALEALFVSPRIPWKPAAEAAARTLLALAVEADLVFTDDAVWDWALRANNAYRSLFDADELRGAYGFLSELRNRVRALSRAGGFRALQEAVGRALGFLVDTGRWDTDDERSVQRARELLQDLTETETNLGLRVPDPFGFWLSRMDEETYVPRETRGVVEVYPYRVAAGIAAPLHAVLNLNQDDTEVVSGGFDFLRDDQLRLLGDRVYRRMSAAFLRAYAQVSDSVILSSNSLSSDGAKTPATWFLEHAEIRELRWPPEGRSIIWVWDAYLPAAEGRVFFEAQAFGGAGTQSGAGVQAHAGDRVREISGARGESVARLDLGAWPRGFVEARFASSGVVRDGRAKISQNQLQTFLTCPRSYLISYLLGVDQKNWTPEFLSPRVEGIVLHRCIERIFKAVLDERGGILDADAAEFYADSALDFAEHELSRHYPADLAAYLRGRIVKFCTDAAALLAEVHAGMAIAVSEDEYVRDTGQAIFGAPAAITGRIDAVLQNPENGETVVVDFKRSVQTKHSAASLRTAVLVSAESARDDDVTGSGGNDAESDRDGDLVRTGVATGGGNDYSSGSRNYYGAADDGDDGDEDSDRQPAAQIQLPVYSFILEAAGTAPEDVLAMYYLVLLAADGKRKLNPVYRKDADGKYRGLRGPAELAAAHEFVERVYRGLNASLEAGVFEAREESCPSCAFRAVCRTAFALRLHPPGDSDPAGTAAGGSGDRPRPRAGDNPERAAGGRAGTAADGAAGGTNPNAEGGER